jgi:hypothetical protein
MSDRVLITREDKIEFRRRPRPMHKLTLFDSADNWIACCPLTMATLKRKLKRKLKMRQSFLCLFIGATVCISIILFNGEDTIYLNSHQFLSLEVERHGSPLSASTTLASRQSYGFFNDILNRNWKYKQEKAERSHNSIRNTRSSRLSTEGESSMSQTLNSLQVRA